MSARTILSLLVAPALLAGCASFSPDGGMGEVVQDVKRETGANAVKIDSVEAARRAHEQVSALLAEPLSADAAVQVALLGNRDLQAAYNDLGISEADYVQQSLPPNPTFSFMTYGGTGVADFEVRLIQDILSLITLPRRSRIAAEHFEHARHGAVQKTLALAGDVRRAWVRTIAAERQVRFLEEARRTADESARLMAKLGEAGGGDQLEQAEIAAFYAELSVRLGQARLAARRQRETLTRLMGLWGADVDFRLPDDLPPLPGEPRARADVEAQAIERRVDLVMARHDVVALAKSLELTQATRYVSMLQLAGLVNNENANPLTTTNTSITRGGGALEFEIPIFDTGEARERKARETYMRAVNRLAAKAVNARSEARIAYDAYRSTWDIARFYEKRVLPLRQVVSKQMALRYGAAVLANESMRVDYFRVLADQRARIAANAAALDARRDFDLAAIDLQAALTYGMPLPTASVTGD
ncbi:TolC family protein [Enhydrobacter sp.]|jgi:outer membrane protein TolC|uniref:TolC family protein n=1 Tax=Enhydrobacter sp. TaxID=1894999 RepID=UPI0026156E9F|nr:TolC family protein [Enhydrobacter sp.]WIM09191.1 MAG: Copper tolerance protein [Enhydrobacter sp.]